MTRGFSAFPYLSITPETQFHLIDDFFLARIYSHPRFPRPTLPACQPIWLHGPGVGQGLCDFHSGFAGRGRYQGDLIRGPKDEIADRKVSVDLVAANPTFLSMGIC